MPLCKSNYKTGTKATTFRFPSDDAQREKWVSAIPRKRKTLKITKNTVVCEKHWPDGYESYVHYGKLVPIDPPSLFNGIPASCIPSQSKRRTTKKALTENRSILPDEMDSFTEYDSLTYENLDKRAMTIDGVTVYEEGN